jgi:hypothetical protein
MDKRYKTLIIEVVLVLIVYMVLFVRMIPVEEVYSNVAHYDRKATYEVISAELVETWNIERGEYVKSEITLKNTDSHDGVFTVDYMFYFIP